MMMRNRTIAVGCCVAMAWAPVLLYVWVSHAVHVVSPAQPARWIVELGVAPWLTIGSDAARSASAGFGSWSVDLFGVLLDVALSLTWVLLAWFVVRWLVKNSALVQKCDRCGYALQGRAEPVSCPECGEAQRAEDRALAISRRSWFLLFTALAICGTAGAGLAIEVALRAASAVTIGLNPSGTSWNPDWWPNELLGWFLCLFALGGGTFAVWLYSEPCKHPPDRLASLFRRNSR